MEIRWLGEVCSALPYWNLQRNPYSVWSKLSGVALKPPKGKSRHRFLRGLLISGGNKHSWECSAFPSSGGRRNNALVMLDAIVQAVRTR